MIALSLARALRSLREPGVLWHLLWPALGASVVWTVAGVLAWPWLIGSALDALAGVPVIGSGIAGDGWLAAVLVVLVKLGVAFAFLPVIYLTAALLVSVFAIPLMLERVGARDYADLEQRRGGSNVGSVANALLAGLVFAGLLILSLPLWLIPGAAALIVLALTAWLNHKAFGYDALMLHADRSELRFLPQRLRGQSLSLGVVCALLAYVPVVNLFAPAFCGLAFVHFMLEALRQRRLAEEVVVLDPVAGTQ